MTPRERLISALEIGLEHAENVLSRHEVDLGRTTHSNKAEAETLEDELKQIHDAIELTKSLAIGKWVPVEERLPEKSGPYMVQWSTKRESNPYDVWFDAEAYRDFGGWACVNRYATITHWLELDLPNEKGE